MMRTFDRSAYDAFTQLLAQPDPKDLPRRAHVYRCAGDPDRRTSRLPGILMGWLQRRHLDVDAHEPLTTAIRKWNRRERPAKPGLRLLRPTGTG